MKRSTDVTFSSDQHRFEVLLPFGIPVLIGDLFFGKFHFKLITKLFHLFPNIIIDLDIGKKFILCLYETFKIHFCKQGSEDLPFFFRSRMNADLEVVHIRRKLRSAEIHLPSGMRPR